MSGKSARRLRKRELEQQRGATPSTAGGNAASRRQAQAQMQAVSMQFSGPLPMPGMLQEYDDVVPGSGERILRMAEAEQLQRHGLERSFITYRFVSLICATIVALAIIGGGFYLIAIGRNAEGIALIVGEIVSLVGIFLFQQYRA